jgi:hypothetical protein
VLRDDPSSAAIRYRGLDRDAIAQYAQGSLAEMRMAELDPDRIFEGFIETLDQAREVLRWAEEEPPGIYEIAWAQVAGLKTSQTIPARQESSERCRATRTLSERSPSSSGRLVPPWCWPASTSRSSLARVIETERQAAAFMKSVKFALRYGSGRPLPSLYAEAADQRGAIELTNALLARDVVIETNVIGDRLVLAHRDVVPALWKLRTRFRSELTPDAARAFELLQEQVGVNAGDVRRLLGVRTAKRPDRADAALAELMREMHVDRGPSSVPKKGIPYLSKEGFPYRVFERAHADLVAAAGKLTIERAVETVVAPLRHLPRRTLASLLRACVRSEELARLGD